jgi:hypothetical protein
MLLGKIHRPQRTGPEKSYLRNGSPVFITWVKSRTLGTVECRDRLKPSEGRGLRVMWTYRIGQDLFSAGRSCHSNQRGKREGRVKWKVPDHHAVAAYQPNIPDSLV